MKEWNPSSVNDFNNPMRKYDIYLEFIDILKVIKQIQPEIMIVEKNAFKNVEKIIKNNFIDDFEDRARKVVGIEKIIVQNNCDDFSHYQMYYDVLHKNIHVTPYYKIENKEENNMFKILEIYKEKKTREIEQKYDAQLEDLEFNDPAQILINETEEKLKEMLETDKVMISVNSDTVNLTPETLEKMKEIKNTIYKEKEELNNVIKEIEALLEFAPNYEESTKILLAYDIIDKKGKIK